MAIDIPSENEHAAQMKRRSYRAILELSSRHPLLTPRDIALLVGASEPWVKKIMKADSFLAQRAALVEKLYGPQLEEIRGKMLQTTNLLIEAVAKRIANPDALVSEETLLKALTVMLDRMLPVKGAASAPLAPATPSTTNITITTGITAEDLHRARARVLDQGAAIRLEHQPNVVSAEYQELDEDGIPKEQRVRSYEDGS